MDGGFLLTGSIWSLPDEIFYKFDSLANLQWSTYSGIPHSPNPFDIKQLADSNYIVLHQFQNDSLGILKINPTGTILWHKIYNNFGNTTWNTDTYAQNLNLIGDSIIVVSVYYYLGNFGTRDSIVFFDNNGNYLSSLKNGNDQLIIEANGEFTTADIQGIYRLNSSGNILWYKDIASLVSIFPPWGGIYSMLPTIDGGYILAAERNNPQGNIDVLLIKTDSVGDTLWVKQFGSSYYDEIPMELKVFDDGFGLIGFVDHDNTGTSSLDIYIVKTDLEGNILSNTITGNIYNDFNSNCIKDGIDLPQINCLLQLASAFDTTFSITDINGNYYFKTDSGNYTISQVVPIYHNLVCPTINAVPVSFTSYDSTAVINFSDSIQMGITEVSISQNGRFRPGFTTHYNVTFSNNGTDTVSGNVVLQLDTTIVYVNANPLPVSIIGNTLIWNYDSLIPNETRFIYISSLCPASISIGTPLINIAWITPVINDTIPLNNNDTAVTLVVGAFDPNEKMVEPKGIGASGAIPLNQDKLTYTIHFENTGNFPAENVEVIDTIDANLDFSSIHIIAASHPYRYTLSGTGIIHFYFDSIMLPDTSVDESKSHGFIKFSVDLEQGLLSGTQIANRASIIFDFNYPIITNRTLNTFAVFTSVNAQKNNSIDFFSSYPNPFSDKIYLVFDKPTSTMGYIQVYNSIGAKVFAKEITCISQSLDLSMLPTGFYMLIISDVTETKAARLIKN